MRYYSLVLNTSAEEIKENARVNLREYGYDNTLVAVNNYMSKNMKNHFTFCAYREGENVIFATFSFDDKFEKFKDAYDHILGLLKDAFQIGKVKEQPEEITMYQFSDDIFEAKRRDYLNMCSRIVETSRLWFYEYYTGNKEHLFFHFNEKIVSDQMEKCDWLFDESLKNELINIETHKNTSEFHGNMVHYIISSRSVETTSVMTEALMQSLLRANRISSRRMEIISELEPEVYQKANRLEDIIENSFGGVVVFDLTEKFGDDPTSYVMASKYIANLVKQYRNHCLFVFTYNMDNPGFSYYLLPQIKKYVIPVALREGTGDRKAAVNYMKKLITESDYAKYSDQAAEYLKRFPGNEFTQTDVLMAYEQFESWCLNKNVLHAYDCDISGDFLLDRDENVESSYEKLQKLVGLDIVKEKIDSIIASDIVEKERKKRRGKDYQTSTMHMIFGGNPGSAKTTVAKLFAGIAKEKGILKSGAFVEKGGMDLDGLGCVQAIRAAFLAAKGGVLFIDEAYTLKSDTAVAVLLQEMENQREHVIVILAGYNERMQAFLDINEGLKSRIPYWVEFPDYFADELTDIFKLMVQERGFCITDDAVKEAHYIFEKVRITENFGNGRYARNLLDRAIQNQSVRILSAENSVSNIRKEELFLITKEDIGTLSEGLKEERSVGTARKEFNDLIGLSSVKTVINKAIANYKLNKLCLERGIPRNNVSLHMVFTGNPGTAKTTVARLFAEIMKDEKVLSTGTFVEVGRADLVGDHVGATAKLVKRKFKEAQGGVLFVDEAYSLCDSYEHGFGDEAINTLVQEMENHRDDVIVIFAGYPEPMKEFLDRNPGMLSRIAFQIEFEDYTTEELCEITKLMLSQKKMTITDAAMNKLRENFVSVRADSDYGNGRYVRKMLEEAGMNLAERLLELGDAEITTELLTTIDEDDIPTFIPKKITKKQIGFAC